MKGKNSGNEMGQGLISNREGLNTDGTGQA